jgi:hypothetical protein
MASAPANDESRTLLAEREKMNSYGLKASCLPGETEVVLGRE